jgi:hypothetical protein
VIAFDCRIDAGWAAKADRCPSRKEPFRSATVVFLASTQQPQDSAAAAEAVRIRRLRDDARRPMSINLAEGIALSHKLMQFVGTARPR